MNFEIYGYAVKYTLIRGSNCEVAPTQKRKEIPSAKIIPSALTFE